MKAVVCLPTYNERENLERMVDALADKGVSVLVIDDNSPDGTGELADRLAAEHDHVEVLHRPRKEGLGPAYLAGFERALADPEVELVLEMDADFSHDPADVPRLIAAAADADLVLGSRYVEGGSIGSWGAAAALRLGGRLALRARAARRGRARPDRRLQVLPPPRCWRRSTSARSTRAATPSRSRPPTARCGPASASSRCRSPSSTASTAARR